jgi:hypothetical protein
MKKTTIAIVLLLAAALLAAGQPGWRSQAVRRGMAERGLFQGRNALPVRLLLRNKDELGLSAEQASRISAMQLAHQERAVKLGADMRIKAVKLRAAAAKGDDKAAEMLIREQAGMRAEMQIARLRFTSEVRGVLSAEQLAKAAQLRNKAGAQGRVGMRRRAAARGQMRRGRRF